MNSKRKGLFVTAFLLCLNLSMAAQSVSLQMKGVTVKKAMSELRQKSGYSFVFEAGDLDMQKVVSVNAKNVRQAIDQILHGQNLSYEIKGKNIIVSKSLSQNTQRPQTADEKKKVGGVIRDENGDPVIGATVRQKGAQGGAITDLDGRFTLMVDEGSELEISYIGYNTKTVRVGRHNTYDISLSAGNAKELNEVVVTALGIKREQKALSYNVQQVGGDALAANKDANFINSLSGKVAGVNINASSSGAGGASKVVMRGTRSIEQSSNVLYVIDGVPMFNLGGGGDSAFGSNGTTEAIADINPEDIESMSVLTGAAAAALYGNRASNGAIVITTKKGKTGHTEFTVSQSTEFSNAFRLPEFQNRYGTGSSLREAGADSYSWGRRLNDANYMGYDPKKDYLKTGVMTTEAFSLSTGSEKNQTYFSASALNSGGIIPNNRYNRYNFTFRNTSSMLGDRLLLDVGASYVIQNDRNMTNQGVYANPLVSAYLYPRGNDYNDMAMFEHFDTTRNIYTQNWNNLLSEFVGQNPYWINYRNLRTNKKYRYMMNAGVTYKITDWLNVVGRIRIDNATNTYQKKYFASTNTTIAGVNGQYAKVKTDDKQAYGDFMLNVNKRFLQDRLSLVANMGGSLSDIKQDQTGVDGPIADNLIPNVFNEYQIDVNREARQPGGYHEQTKSLFASVELGWASQYYLTVTGRNDWPSMLAGPHSNKRSFFYPSVGGSWIVSETLKLPKAIDYLKVRGSFASVGIPFLRNIANPKYEWDNNTKQWKSQTIYPIYDLKPETTNSWEVGLQARFFKHFNLDVTLYWTKTFNQTFNPDISVSSGYSALYIQTGNVSNNGIELALGYSNNWGGFGWSSSYTLSSNRNRINELVRNYVHPETGAVINKDRLDVGGLGNAHFILKEGGTLGDLYSLTDVKRDDKGRIYVDKDGKVYRNNNVGDVKLGSVFPKANMAWRNEFSYKGFNLGVMVSARFGGIVYSATQAALDLYGVSEASAKARDNKYVKVNGNDFLNPESWYSTIGASDGIPQYYTYSATNVRLQEASIGYTFKKRNFFGLGDLTLSLTGRNLLMFYCKAPFDPETTATTGNYYQGIDKFMTPSTRNIGFNIKLKF
ncbi:TonB-linked outer membrane protein, SusC/RagA family [Segatella baroniae F0067]|uniref:TonB-linked outer membrane protein, SusC/RagA family n=1 Tax=Segatella baroniae F0067 TaxID=1115809 RepID=U2NJ27_9BACT|nr:SusC/RagA family TonB-linked outer membrane protein [Segatella baroniae]ERK38115.1 TonB-linked outer membrane protein, SusC/RagA family [Segatella baroniae F0067]